MHRVLHVFVEWIKLRWSDFERHLEMPERLEGFLSECRSLGFQNEASVVTRNMSMRAMRYQKRNPVQRKTVAPGFTFTENTPLLSRNRTACGPQRRGSVLTWRVLCAYGGGGGL